LGASTNATVSRSNAIATIVDNDAPAGAPVVSVSDAIVDETGGEVTFVVTLDRPSSGSVTMNYVAQGGTASVDSDYRATSGSLGFAPGETVKTVRVPLLNDASAEVSETFNLELSNLVGATSPDRVGTAVIVANDTSPVATPVITVEDVTVGESQGYADFVVRLNAPSANLVTVNYNLYAGTASSTADFDVYSGTLRFAPGEVLRTVRVNIDDDTTPTAAELHEGFSLLLNAAVNAEIGRPWNVATIVDNEATAGVPAVTISDPVVDEAAREVSFVVALDRPSLGSVSMNFAAQDGTAVAGSDYVATSGIVGFAPGETAKTIKVSLLNDAVVESGETFNLALWSPVGATITDGTGTAMIGDNDAPTVMTPVITVADAYASEDQGYVNVVVRLSAPSANLVSVNWYQTSGTATQPDDYIYNQGTLQFAPGETLQTVPTLIADDGVAESLELFSVNLSSAVNATIGQTQATVTIGDHLHVGTWASEDVFGSPGNVDDYVFGVDGNDLLWAGDGNDRLDGGAGDDELVVMPYDGTDTLIGGDGIDFVSYQPSWWGVYVVLSQGAYGDTFSLIEGVTGSNFDDVLSSGTLPAKLYGGMGNDVIVGGPGADLLNGGYGDDYIYVTAYDGADVIDGGPGYDILSYAGANTPLSIDLSTLYGDSVTGIEAVQGSLFDDVMTGTAGVDRIDGNEGSDTINAGAGNDTILMRTWDGSDQVNGGDGSDTVSYEIANTAVAVSLVTPAFGDTFVSIENLTGSPYDDTVTGDGNANRLNGLGGNDTMTGGAGVDTFLFTVVANALTNKDTITDFLSGTDRLEFSKAVFVGLGTTTGPLAAEQFWSGAGVTAAHDATDRVVYDTTTGAVYYDADGLGGADAVQVAVLGTTTHPGLLYTDVLIGG
jgi:Ca2+-binding RTX toxin-like protein